MFTWCFSSSVDDLSFPSSFFPSDLWKNLPLAQFLACFCDVFLHLLMICHFLPVYSNFCYITFSYAGKYLVFFFYPLDLWVLDVSILFDYKFAVLCYLHAIPLNLSHLFTIATVVNIVLKVTDIKSFINWTHVILNYNMLYESIEHRTKLKLSRHLPNYTMFDLFRDFF